VLAIVQGEQQPRPPQDVGQGLQQRAPGLLADAERGSHARDDQVGLPHVSQLDEPHPIGEFTRHRGEQPQRQPGFPDAPGPAQRQRAG
jgi:hypothetical protein